MFKLKNFLICLRRKFQTRPVIRQNDPLRSDVDLLDSLERIFDNNSRSKWLSFFHVIGQGAIRGDANLDKLEDLIKAAPERYGTKMNRDGMLFITRLQRD